MRALPPGRQGRCLTFYPSARPCPQGRQGLKGKRAHVPEELWTRKLWSPCVSKRLLSPGTREAVRGYHCFSGDFLPHLSNNGNAQTTAAQRRAEKPPRYLCWGWATSLSQVSCPQVLPACKLCLSFPFIADNSGQLDFPIKSQRCSLKLWQWHRDLSVARRGRCSRDAGSVRTAVAGGRSPGPAPAGRRVPNSDPGATVSHQGCHRSSQNGEMRT